MKAWILATASVTALAGTISPIAIGPAAAEVRAENMAAKSNPNFVYTGPLGVAGYHTFRLAGVPEDVTVSGVQVQSDYGYGEAASTPSVMVAISDTLGLTANTSFGNASIDGTVADYFNFIVTYSDGSATRFRQKVSFTPDKQADAYNPYFVDRDFEVGTTTQRELTSVPVGAKLNVVSTPMGWSASPAEGNTLAVTAPEEPTMKGNNRTWKPPKLELSVVYPDGSSEVVQVSVIAIPKESESQQPSENDAEEDKPPTSDENPPAGNGNSSSTGGIGAAVIAVLVVIGGGVAAVLNSSNLLGSIPW